MKYIVIEGQLPFIFPKMINHADFAESVQHHFGMQHNMFVSVTSAGFIRDSTGIHGLHCFGRSDSLDLDSNKDDSLLLRKLL